MKSGVYVRAKTSDDRWATVAAEQLTDESFKIFVLRKMAEAGIVAGIVDDGRVDLETELTKQQTEL
jgi:hypothetical protein